MSETNTSGKYFREDENGQFHPLGPETLVMTVEQFQEVIARSTRQGMALALTEIEGYASELRSRFGSETPETPETPEKVETLHEHDDAGCLDCDCSATPRNNERGCTCPPIPQAGD